MCTQSVWASPGEMFLELFSMTISVQGLYPDNIETYCHTHNHGLVLKCDCQVFEISSFRLASWKHFRVSRMGQLCWRYIKADISPPVLFFLCCFLPVGWHSFFMLFNNTLLSDEDWWNVIASFCLNIIYVFRRMQLYHLAFFVCKCPIAITKYWFFFKKENKNLTLKSGLGFV